MVKKEKKSIISTIVDDLVKSTKNQHQITKERHNYAKKSHAEKQRIELAELQSKNNSYN